MARQIPSLTAWIGDRQRRADLAKAAGTSGDYLYQIATGRRRASVDLAEAIDRATRRAVTKEQVLFGEEPKRTLAKPSREKVA